MSKFWSRSLSLAMITGKKPAHFSDRLIGSYPVDENSFWESASVAVGFGILQERNKKTAHPEGMSGRFRSSVPQSRC